MPLELDLRMFRKPSTSVKFHKEHEIASLRYAPTGDFDVLKVAHILRSFDQTGDSFPLPTKRRLAMTNKQRIEKIDEAWQKKAAESKQNIAVVKCQPKGKAERIKGIQV
jgi:hypothetical protein